MRDVNSSTVTLPRSVSMGIGSSIVTNREFQARCESSRALVSPAEAVERRSRPQVDFPFGKGGRSVGLFVQIVQREDFPISPRLQHGLFASLADHVDLVI